MSTPIKNTNSLFDDQYPGRDFKEVKVTWATHVYVALLVIAVVGSWGVLVFAKYLQLDIRVFADMMMLAFSCMAMTAPIALCVYSGSIS